MATAAQNLRSTGSVSMIDSGLLIQFLYLQGMDLLTTTAFLLAGVREANPFVKFAMGATGNPMLGLTLVKAAGMLLGLYCWKWGRTKLLRRANVFFALLVAWNLFCLILGLGQKL